MPDCASRRSQRVDAAGSRYCARSFVAIVLGALCLAPGVGWAGPGDPFGPDDTGCAPATRDELHCESALTGALARLVAQMTGCKLQQADNAFRILHPRPGSTPPPRFDEEGCAQSQAKVPFDQALSQLEGAGSCPPAALINAHALGDTLVAGRSTPGSLDALDGAIYCDATSGTLIEPAGSASGGSGFVPSTARHLRCSDAVGKSLAQLARGLIRCHLRVARAAFHNQPIANQLGPGAHGTPYAAQLSGFVKSITVFSEEACERHAQGRYRRSARRLAAGGICPSCLDLTQQLAMGDAAVARAEQESGVIFTCPGSTTSTTTTTTSTARPLTTTTQPATTTTTTQASTTSTSSSTTTQPPTTTTQAPTTPTTTRASTTSTTSSTTTQPPTTTTSATTTTSTSTTTTQAPTTTTTTRVSTTSTTSSTTTTRRHTTTTRRATTTTTTEPPTTTTTSSSATATSTTTSTQAPTSTTPTTSTTTTQAPTTTTTQSTTTTTLTFGTTTTSTLPAVFVIVMENQDWSNIAGNPSAPYINNTLLPMASYAKQYYNPPGNHPSEPNYLWLEAGTNFGIRDDNSPANNHQGTTSHLVSLLNAAGVSWKTYQEDISGTVCPVTDYPGQLYVTPHNPFVFFDDVTGSNNPADAYCIVHVRPYSELATDLSNNTVARYNFITPNVCNNMHSSCAPLNDNVKQGDVWLSTEVPKILASQAYTHKGVLFITWDEAETGDGPIGMIVLSPVAKSGGYSNRIHYTHSSTLRTVEEIFGVSPLLGDAANATDLRDLLVSFP